MFHLTGRIALSASQERMWVLDQLSFDGTYNVTECFRMTGPLDESAFRQSLRVLVDRHEALRTCVDDVGGTPVGRLVPSEEADVEVHRVGLGQQDPEPVLTEAAQRPFDLARAPLLRALIVDLTDAERLILLVLHHAAVDGWSGRILRRELWQFYEDFAVGREAAVPKPASTLAAYAEQQQQWRDGPEARQQLEYWQQQLADPPPPLEFPSPVPGERPAPGSTAAAVIRSALPPAAVQAVMDVSHSVGATPFMVLLAAFAAALGRYAPDREVVIGTPVTDRPSPAWEQVIGSFDNTVLLRLRTDATNGAELYVEHVCDVVVDALLHRDVPFQDVIRVLAPRRSAAGALPLCNAAFSIEQTDDECFPAGAAEVRVHPWSFAAPARFDLTLMVELSTTGMVCRLYRDPGRVDQATGDRILTDMTELLGHFAGRPDAAATATPTEDPHGLTSEGTTP
ncbi:condensation domain-containing protein [Streptomyces sp. NPDC001709]